MPGDHSFSVLRSARERHSQRSRLGLGALVLLLLMLAALGGCADRSVDAIGKYRGDEEEMMSIPYTPRDDGQPLTAAELYAFKTVSDLDRDLSEEEAHIVELHFKFFVHEHRRTFERFVQRSARFLPHVRKTFAERGIPGDIAYLCMVESGGNPVSRSPMGAAGLWQFMPSTGRRYGLTQNNWIDERRDPYKATAAASEYLLKLYQDFSNWHLAVAAYNAGEGKIGRAVSGTGAKDFFDLCRLDGQLDERERLREETRDYVPRLIAVAKIMRNLNRLGFEQSTPDMVWNLKPVEVPPNTNLAGLAARLGITWEDFSGMNPAYRRTTSPPTGSTTAYVPPEKLAQASAWVAGNEARKPSGWQEYTVQRGDTLVKVAKRYNVAPAAIKDANGFDKFPGRGAVILIPARGAAVASAYDGSPTGTSPGVYTVKAGDTLSQLALVWGTNVTAIRLANGMTPTQTALKLGQRLRVPAGSTKKPAGLGARQPAAAPVAASGTYTVQAGDTVYGIALKTGSSTRAICEANNLDPAKLRINIGQKLIIPGKAPSDRPGGEGGDARTPKAAASPGAKSTQKATAASGRTVTVKSGDTLLSLARANGTTVKALCQANGLNEKATLRIGRNLRIP